MPISGVLGRHAHEGQFRTESVTYNRYENTTSPMRTGQPNINLCFNIVVYVVYSIVIGSCMREVYRMRTGSASPLDPSPSKVAFSFGLMIAVCPVDQKCFA